MKDLNQIEPCEAKTGISAHSLLRILAGLSLLIGIMGLVALFSPQSKAEDGDDEPGMEESSPTNPSPGMPIMPPAPQGGDTAPATPGVQVQKPRGFQQGARTFDNPFNSNQPKNGKPSMNPPAPQQEIRAGGQPDPKDVPAPKITNKGIEVGGGLPGGVVSNSDEKKTLDVDEYTGKGSSQVITDFNYPDVDIMDLAKTMGKLTGKNFIVDNNVKGRITIISNQKITVADAWKAFLTALDVNGFTLIPSGEFIRIARQRDARDKQLRTYIGKASPDTDAMITRVFALKYIAAEEVARVFRSFMGSISRIIPHEQTNTVIVTDTGTNIQKLAKMLEFLDVEGFDAGIEVIPVKYASAPELAKLIDTLVPGTQQAAQRGRNNFNRNATFQSRRTKEGGLINTVIADDRTNSLIVHANAAGADEVRALVTKLDKRVPVTSGGGKIHVIYLQFSEAEEIAKTLKDLSSSSNSSSRTAPSAGRGGAGGMTTGTNPLSTNATLFEGSIQVSADKSTNSLVVTASPSDFGVLQRVVAKLDIPRDEVYVEAVLMEMNIGKDFDWSTGVIAPNAGVISNTGSPTDLASVLANPMSKKGVILGFKDGAEKKFKFGDQEISIASVTALVKFLQTNTQANILATPQILTLDNHEATFETAENIPVPTTTATNGAIGVGVTKEKVALELKIKPQINKISNFVKLDIKAKMEDFSDRELPVEVQSKAKATFSRRAETNVVVANSDTVVLGGLVRDKSSETTSKVPILGDIPILGWLFKSTTLSSAKTNLLIFITPHIIKQYEKVRALLDEKLKERDNFIEQKLGGDDPHREYRDEMIRKLPEVKELTTYTRPTAQLSNESGSYGSGTTGSPSNNPFLGTDENGAPLTPAPPMDNGIGQPYFSPDGSSVPNELEGGMPPPEDAPQFPNESAPPPDDFQPPPESLD